jgi:hypothetical protein
MVIKNMVDYLIYNLLYGIKPAIIAVISNCILWQKVVENRLLGVILWPCFTIVTIANQRNCLLFGAGLVASLYSIQKKDHFFKNNWMSLSILSVLNNFSSITNFNLFLILSKLDYFFVWKWLCTFAF